MNPSFSFIDPFTGQTISPSPTGYELLEISSDVKLQWPVNGNTELIVANVMDINPLTAGLTVQFPSAQQVSIGQTTVVRNLGSNPLRIAGYDNNQIALIEPGIAYYIYVTDNTSDAGVWHSIIFGAGTSALDATILAGYGLVAFNQTLNQSYPTTAYFSNSLINFSDRAKFIVWEGGSGTFTLPDASQIGNNFFFMARNNGSGVLTLIPNEGQLINGQSSLNLQLTDSCSVVCDGTNWFTFGLGRSSQFIITQNVQTVTGGTVVLTSSQSANIIQEYIGELTSNVTIVFPNIVNIYSIRNSTTGSYLLRVTTATIGAPILSIPQGQTLLVICDGSILYAANSSGFSFDTVTLIPGSNQTPSLNYIGDTSTGLYSPSSGQMAMSSQGTDMAIFTPDGAIFPFGVYGGVFI